MSATTTSAPTKMALTEPTRQEIIGLITMLADTTHRAAVMARCEDILKVLRGEKPQ